MPDPKNFFGATKRRRQLFWPSRGSGGMLSRNIFKIKGPRLAKNAFPQISARKNLIKMSQHVALLFNLGCCSLHFHASENSQLSHKIVKFWAAKATKIIRILYFLSNAYTSKNAKFQCFDKKMTNSIIFHQKL